MWEAASGRELLTLKGHSAPISSVAFSPDGQRIVTGSGDQTAKVWEAASGRELLTLKGHSNAIRSVAFSPDGQRIVTGSWDQTAKVWEAASGRELLTLKGHSECDLVCGLFPGRPADCHRQLGSDGQGVGGGQRPRTAHAQGAQRSRLGLWPFPRTASGLSPAVRIGRPRCGRRPAAGNCSRSRGTAMRLCLWPFPRTASGLSPAVEDQTAKVWEAASGRELLTLKGHSDAIKSVAFSPDGQRIVTGSEDETAKVWEAASGRELLTLKGHSDCDYGLWPFPRTASGLSPAVRIRRPRCGRRPAAGNCSRSRGTALD